MNRLKSFTSYCIAVGLSIIPALANAQTCKPLTDSKAFPPLAALVDSAALVAALPPAFAGGPSEVLVSVMMGPTPQGHTMHSTAAPATGTIIGEQILAFPPTCRGRRSVVPRSCGTRTIRECFRGSIGPV